MCETCGCDEPRAKAHVDLETSLLARSAHGGAHVREHLGRIGCTALNVMGSPGSGKTALLEATARALEGRLRLAAMVGDLETDLDAKRLAAAGIPSVAITTGQACHLDADHVHEALHDLALEGVDVLFIENVGNLVCPALFDVGQSANVVCLSVTEGVDKPLKYPPMFRRADLVLLTKADLLPHLPGVTVAAYEDALARVMPEPRLLPVSSLDAEGVKPWTDWLLERVGRPRREPASPCVTRWGSSRPQSFQSAALQPFR